jgi:hypothetical protein
MLDKQIERSIDPRPERVKEQVVSISPRPIGNGHPGIVGRDQPSDPNQREDEQCGKPTPELDEVEFHF